MYNLPTEWDKGFKKGLEIGQKIGFFEAKIQAVSSELSSISESLDKDEIKASVIIELDDCISKLDDALENLTNI